MELMPARVELQVDELVVESGADVSRRELEGAIAQELRERLGRPGTVLVDRTIGIEAIEAEVGAGETALGPSALGGQIGQVVCGILSK